MFDARRFLITLLVALGAALSPGSVFADVPGTKALRLPCGTGLVHHRGGLRLAAAATGGVRAGRLRLEYIAHSTFLITSPRGIRVITDYNENFRARVLPHIATMSAWHRNHSTAFIQPQIVHALRGWDDGGARPRHDVHLDDVRVYNVEINKGVGGDAFYYPSSMFITQSQGFCIAHLGLLAHALDKAVVKRTGRIDVLLVPVDQRVSMSFEEIAHNIKIINPRIVVPMHYFWAGSLPTFLELAARVFPVRRLGASTYMLERATLPRKTEVLFMTPSLEGSTF